MGLRYQVLDATGAVRESLHWPMPAPPHQHWRKLVPGEHEAPILGRLAPGRVTDTRLLRTDRHGRRKRRSNAALRILPQGA
jgi:hypothetical protein